MPKSFFNRFFLLIRYGDTRLLEIFMGLFFLIWGSYVFLVRDAFTSYAVFTYVSRLTPGWGLGGIIALMGLAILTLSVCDKIKIHRLALLFGHAVWLFLATFAMLGDRQSPAVATYSFVAGAMLYLYWRSP